MSNPNIWACSAMAVQGMVYSMVDENERRLAYLDNEGNVHVNPDLSADELRVALQRSIRDHRDEAEALKKSFHSQSTRTWVLRVIRSECKNEDVWYFATENEANKARDYALNVIRAEKANVDAFDPNPETTSLDEFKESIRDLEGWEASPGKPELTSVKLGTPEWVKEIVIELGELFLDEELFDHIEPCLKILRDHGATVESHHSGGGNMHALGVIEKDGLAVLFWTGADAVGAHELFKQPQSPSQAWQDIQHEEGEDSSLLAEVVAK